MLPFHDLTVVQPDIFYISGRQKQIVQETRIDGPPALVVEILSPSNSRKDRLQKLQIYQKVGVAHYWLVDPEQKTLECFALRDGVYALVAAGMEGEIVEHPDFAGLAIDLSVIFK
jgi:Uma2 family endonuclease